MRAIKFEINDYVVVELNLATGVTDIWLKDQGIASAIRNSSLAGRMSCINVDERSLLIDVEEEILGIRFPARVVLDNGALCIEYRSERVSARLTDSEAQEFCHVMNFICNEVLPKPYEVPYLVRVARRRLGLESTE